MQMKQFEPRNGNPIVTLMARTMGPKSVEAIVIYIK